MQIGQAEKWDCPPGPHRRIPPIVLVSANETGRLSSSAITTTGPCEPINYRSKRVIQPAGIFVITEAKNFRPRKI